MVKHTTPSGWRVTPGGGIRRGAATLAGGGHVS